MRTLAILLSALIMISSAGCTSLNVVSKKGNKKEQSYSGKQNKKESKKASKKSNKKSYY